MAAGLGDLGPAAFEPEGDLLAYVYGLEITSLVGMVDPPGSSPSRRWMTRRGSHIRVRMVTGDDIGIAMGSGTEIAKNPGRMILSDDNFSTVVRAVEQGRKLYDNLTKYVRFRDDHSRRVRARLPGPRS